MRLAPIPIYYNKNINECLKYSRLSSLTTHPGCIAIEACNAMSYIIVNAINRDTKKYDNTKVKIFIKDTIKEYIKLIEDKCKDIIVQFCELKKEKLITPKNKMTIDINLYKLIDKKKGNNNNKEEQLKLADNLNAKQLILQLLKCERGKDNHKSTEYCWKWDINKGNLGVIKTMNNRGTSYNGYPNSAGYFGSYCLDGLAMGLHSFYHSTSIGTSIECAANMLGDADSTASIAGQMAGAYYGFNHTIGNNKSNEYYMFEYLSKWDNYDFGLRGVLLSVLALENQEKNEKNNNN